MAPHAATRATRASPSAPEDRSPAAFASAVFLLGVAALMAFGSVERLFSPQAIHYREALTVTVLGLLVNLACARIPAMPTTVIAMIMGTITIPTMGTATDMHGHAHHHGHDINLRSAYLHVIADAATSVLAVLALAGGWWLGWRWLDRRWACWVPCWSGAGPGAC